ncbi:MAG TPA: hypothetical protein VJC17_01495 [Candidatus Dojkabacteria bacterium]|nr:hypothetical protein [Candidatus Dojkabacteria bacterium]
MEPGPIQEIGRIVGDTLRTEQGRAALAALAGTVLGTIGAVIHRVVISRELSNNERTPNSVIRHTRWNIGAVGNRAILFGSLSLATRELWPLVASLTYEMPIVLADAFLFAKAVLHTPVNNLDDNP